MLGRRRVLIRKHQNTIEEADVARVVDAGEEHSVPDEEPDAPGTLQVGDPSRKGSVL